MNARSPETVIAVPNCAPPVDVALSVVDGAHFMSAPRRQRCTLPTAVSGAGAGAAARPPRPPRPARDGAGDGTSTLAVTLPPMASTAKDFTRITGTPDQSGK